MLKITHLALSMALLAALPIAANAQWTHGGGGDHTGWDYTPPNNQDIGGVHTGINVFTILDGEQANIVGGSTAYLDAVNFVLDGDLNAVSQSVVIGSDDFGASIMGGGAGTLVTLINPPLFGFAVAAATLDWNDVSPPGSLYDFEISDMGTAGPGGAVTPPLDLASATGLPTLPTQITASPTLADATYFWRVRVNPAGAWSEVWEFTVDNTPPPAPILLDPINSESASRTPLYDWTDVFDASGVAYTIIVDDDCTFGGSPEVAVTGLGLSAFFTATPLAAGDYCWRVTAIDGAGNMTTSTIGNFVVDGVAPPPSGDGSSGSPGGCSFLQLAAPASAVPGLLAFVLACVALWVLRGSRRVGLGR